MPNLRWYKHYRSGCDWRLRHQRIQTFLFSLIFFEKIKNKKIEANNAPWFKIKYLVNVKLKQQ